MTHADHIQLIRRGISPNETVWADFGSGDGAFTLALREIVGPNAELYSIDTNFNRLEVQKTKFEKMFPGSDVHYLNLDFGDELPLPSLDGIILANSLHYIYDKVPFLRFIQRYLKPQGKLLVVEYNTSVGNVWVPFPVTVEQLKSLMSEAGYVNSTLISTAASEFLGGMYSVYGINP